MDIDNRNILLEVGRGDKDSVKQAAEVVFCENAASLVVSGLTIHISWTELATWQAWLAQRVEQEGQ